MQTRPDLDPQSASEMTDPEEPRQFHALSKDQGVGGAPNPGNFHPFPKIVGIILSFISI